MKNAKKVFAAMLALVLAFGGLSIAAAAAGTPNGNESMQVLVKTDVDTAYSGDYITVTLHITNNYFATNMRFPVLFSADIFELVDANLNLQKLGQLNTVPGAIGANTTGNAAFYPAGYSQQDYGVVLIQWAGDVSGGVYSCYNQPTGQDAISFSLRVKPGAGGEGTILIPPESTLFYYQAMNDPSDFNTIYTMSKATCPMTFTPATMTVVGIAPDIEPVAGTDTVIDTQRNYIYGLEQGLPNLDAYIEPVGGATLEVIKSNGSSCGTGTLVHVLSGEITVKTYTVIIFGDVNGDSIVDNNDVGTMVDYENFLVEWDPVVNAATLFAGNINGDANVDANDAGFLVDVENYLAYIDQTIGLAILY